MAVEQISAVAIPIEKLVNTTVIRERSVAVIARRDQLT